MHTSVHCSEGTSRHSGGVGRQVGDRRSFSHVSGWTARQHCPHVHRRKEGCDSGFVLRARRGRVEQAPSCTVLNIQPDGSDTWRLQTAIEDLLASKIGIIPTDTSPAFVCCLHDRVAVQAMFDIAGLSVSKKLSVMVRGIAELESLTTGLPAANGPGQPALFRILRSTLPGPYTLILTASKGMPKQVVAAASGKRKSTIRKTVGIRWPDNPVCQALMAGVDGPLLCTTVPGRDDPGGEEQAPDLAELADRYCAAGVGFVVAEEGQRWGASTVIDFSGARPTVVRVGDGDLDPFLPYLPDA
ncbi:CPL11 [Auxenochlorella protothecoides x Auxenochlorella symbiontica]